MEEVDDVDDDTCSLDSVTIEEVLEMMIEEEKLCYLCLTSDGTEEVFDRSDLMDGSTQQKLVLQFERKNPPPWDPVCTWCEGGGCEECECPECDRPCRHLNGLNYGCPKHPVV